MQPVDVYLVRGLARETAHWGGFATQLQKLEAVASVTGLDLLGAGRYNKLTSPITIGENCEFLLSQIPEDSERPRVIVSVSLGSMVAVEMAQRAPSMFSKIFVTNTSFANLSPLHHRLQLEAFKRFFNITKSRSLRDRESEVLKMVSRDRSKHEQVVEEWVAIAEKRPMAVKNFVRQLLAAATYRIADEPPDVPIVVLRSMGDQMVDPSCSQKLAEHWSLPMHTHPSSGHDIFIDDPQWVLDRINDNLNQS